MADENDVKTRHTKLLKKIRKDHADVGSNGHSGARDEKVRAAEQEHLRTESGHREYVQEDRRDFGGTLGGTQGADRTQRAARGPDSGTGSFDPAGFDTTQGADSGDGETREAELISPSPRELDADRTPEEEQERLKELNRQRQQRYRDRQKEESAEPPEKSSPLRNAEKDSVTVRLKNIFKSDVQEPNKPLLMKEADDETRRKLIDLYVRGSSILDDVLEILVKDHEPVSIWELSEDEAGMLVDMQLERARKSAAEARVVRKLIAIYDRLFFAMLIGPRVKATVSHIDRHGGISFR